MKALYKYLKEEGEAATPSNTIGIGNPMPAGDDGNIGSEPLPTAKIKKQKRKKVKESLLDDEEDLINDTSLEDIQWVKDNYTIYSGPNGTTEFTIKNGILNAPNTSFKIKNHELKHLTNGNFKFEEVNVFNLFDCPNLKDLTDGPIKTNVFFRCSNCSNLKNLKGAPKQVGTTFRCSKCEKLETLEGAPERVGSSFICINCKKLKSLKGLPKYIGLDFEYYGTPAADDDSNEKYIKQSKIKGTVEKS